LPKERAHNLKAGAEFKTASIEIQNKIFQAPYQDYSDAE
jgi:hypothetical protein